MNNKKKKAKLEKKTHTHTPYHTPLPSLRLASPEPLKHHVELFLPLLDDVFPDVAYRVLDLLLDSLRPLLWLDDRGLPELLGKVLRGYLVTPLQFIPRLPKLRVVPND